MSLRSGAAFELTERVSGRSPRKFNCRLRIEAISNYFAYRKGRLKALQTESNTEMFADCFQQLALEGMGKSDCCLRH